MQVSFTGALAEGFVRAVQVKPACRGQRMKRLVMDGASASLLDHVGATRAALAECFASEDHAEGVAAFLERREARFTAGPASRRAGCAATVVRTSSARLRAAGEPGASA